MHTIYHTDAIVLKSMLAGEANRRVWLFTRELGLVVALVQGVRKAEAKLKSHIVEYSYIRADLVRGKEVWRLINAETISTPLGGIIDTDRARSFVRILLSIERFVIDEGPHEALFDHVAECAACLADESLPVKAYDTVAIWRVFVLLGYSALDESYAIYMQQPLHTVVTTSTDDMIGVLMKDVQQSIAQTHL